MMKYICETCQKVFSQKGHLEDHNNRKRPCKKDNTIEALVEKKVQEVLSKTNEGVVKIEATRTTSIQSTQMNYLTKTREELIAVCKEKKIKGYSGKKKEEIISLLSPRGIEDVSKKAEITASPADSVTKKLTYIDLFAGIGGFRFGIQAFQASHPQYAFECIKSADIKKDALKTYNHNFHETNQACDVRTIKNLPYFDILCGGFPCQPFSSAGKKEGLKDEGRGDLIYEVLRICKESKPEYIILENVSNIENIENGEVLKTILKEFQTIGYHTTCIPINSSHVGLAQDRKRIFIIGCKSKAPQLIIKPKEAVSIKNIIDTTDETTALPAEFLSKLLELPKDKLIGKSIKDKRGGNSNIHSWEINFHGKISDRQKKLLNTILLERRKKKWAIEKKIKWMDGIPLSFKDIQTFLKYDGLQEDLDDLVEKKYLTLEYPKDVVNGKRVPNQSLTIGYNIAKGKLSFPISKILHPDELCPTLTATDSSKLSLLVGNTVRQLNEKELKLLCGFPEHFSLPQGVNKYDLFGNMVCPPVVTEILETLLPQSE
jgi:DNA (cytosine-5)-methyltransferase 1